MIERPVCLIANPSAGGGRTAKLLPAVESALRGHGIAFRVERTHSLEHARELARATVAAGEVAAAMGGDGLLGALAGELRHTDGVLAVLPGGRGNDFARKLGVGGDPVAACEVLALGREQRLDVADINGRAYLGIASLGARLGRRRPRQRDQAEPRPARLPLRDAAGGPGVAAGALGGRDRRRAAHVRGLLGRRLQLRRVRRRHVPRAGRRAGRRHARRGDDRRRVQAQVPRRAPEGVHRARTFASPASSSCAAGRSPSTPTARSTCRPTATRSPTSRPPCGCSPARCGSWSREPARPQASRRPRPSARSPAAPAAAAARRCPASC